MINFFFYGFFSTSFKWLDLHWMRCQILVLSWELHQHSVTLFHEIQAPYFQQKLEGIICIYHMLALGLQGVFHTWRLKDLTKPSVSRSVNLLVLFLELASILWPNQYCLFVAQSVKPKWERTKETDEHMGWIFPASNTEEPGAESDPLNGAKSIRELYELASTNYSGKYTVPVCYHMSSFPIFPFFNMNYLSLNLLCYLIDFLLYIRSYGIRNSKQLLIMRVQRLSACSTLNSMT